MGGGPGEVPICGQVRPEAESVNRKNSCLGGGGGEHLRREVASTGRPEKKVRGKKVEGESTLEFGGK